MCSVTIAICSGARRAHSSISFVKLLTVFPPFNGLSWQSVFEYSHIVRFLLIGPTLSSYVPIF